MRRIGCLLLFVAAFLLPSNDATAANTRSVPIPWLADFDTAMAKAKQTGDPVFIDCFAEWCNWCSKMEEQIYSDSRFKQFLSRYVPLRINIEDGGRGSALASQYNVKTLPAVLVIDANGSLLNRISGVQTLDQLITDLSMIQALYDRERVNQNEWITVQRLAEEYLFRDMNAEAEIRFARILKAPVDSVVKESAHFSLALAQYYQQKTTEALQTLNTYLETYIDGKSTEEVLLLLSQIYLERSADEEAKQILTQFLKKFPDSKSAKRVREVLSKF